MFRNYLSLLRFLLFCILPLLLYGCGTTSQSINDKTGWVEIDRINLEYDKEFQEKNVFFTADKDYESIYGIFIEYLKNAHLVRLSSKTYLNENNNHQFIIYRKLDGTEAVNFYVYKIEIVYRNYTIIYEFINDPTVGAANYGNKNRYFNLYKGSFDSFYINVDAGMRTIINSLSNSNDSLAIGQAVAVYFCLDNRDPLKTSAFKSVFTLWKKPRHRNSFYKEFMVFSREPLKTHSGILEVPDKPFRRFFP